MQQSETPWLPILTHPAAGRALEAAAEIGFDLRNSALCRGPSLAGGDAGLALYFSYLDQALPSQGYNSAAMEILERAIEVTETGHMLPSLYSGFAGVAWTLEHLQSRLFEEPEEQDAGEEVAAAITKHISLSPWRGDYDLLNGLVGYGIYALERRPRPYGQECLEQVVARLAEIAERGPDGVTWKTGPDLLAPRDLGMFPDGYYDLGLAHGVPGVVGLLALSQTAGVECHGLLDRAVAWLLSRKLPDGYDSCFGYTAVSGGEPKASRLAWCCGDLGIATILMLAGRSMGEECWQAQALELAHKAAQRDVNASGVIDAGLCHGSAGVAHLFNRIYQGSGDPLLRAAAETWFDRTLTSFRKGEGFGGYRMYVPDESAQLGWQKDPGFLTGSAGVGLALLAAATSVEPEWDRVLLTSG